MNLAMLGVVLTVESRNFFFNLSCVGGTGGSNRDVYRTYTRWAATAETSGKIFISRELHVGRDINKGKREFAPSMTVTESGFVAQAALITAFSDGDCWSSN